MCSCADRLRVWLLLLAACLFASACAVRHGCEPEVCDGFDNDCDGAIDESFRDADGRYASAQHCGACDVRCSAVFPSAAATKCEAEGSVNRCRIVRCAEGQRLAGDGACVTNVSVACLPCDADSDCQAYDESARCGVDARGSSRCETACERTLDCATGFACNSRTHSCQALSGACECSADMLAASFGCELQTRDGEQRCPGLRRCTATGLGACEPALSEACNARDDDCDGKIDEDFVDTAGRYVAQLHCGACGAACVAQGPHAMASCVAEAETAHCEYGCDAEHVDVDGVLSNGCECQLSTARAPVVSGDNDCDGVVDATPALVFVSGAGSDTYAGTSPEQAVRTLARGIAQGSALGRTVVVARGIYRERVDLRAGLTLIGGYSPDFTAHDADVYPVLIEAPLEAPGAAVLRCQNIEVATYVADLTLAASDATEPGQGSTGLLLWNCSDAVELHGITVLSGRGASGLRGVDSSALLASRGWSTLAELAGVSGSAGADSPTTCALVAGGSAGSKTCEGANVSGGVGGSARCAALSCSNDGSTACGNAGCNDFTVDGVCDSAAVRRAAVPNPAAETGRGPAPGAAAEATYDAPTNHGACSFCDDNPSLPRIGGAGGSGDAGPAGAAGAACDEPLLVAEDGRVSSGAGGLGSDGGHGSGGGGGSAGAGYAVIGATNGACASVPGAAGGGGGSGGCGAPGAAGGGGGGASVGILVRLADSATRGPVLEAVRVVTASAGDGGDGGIGALGGAGGTGALGGLSHFWCARNGGRGGDGGPGGAAGGGGGGCGGSSFGVYVLAASGGAAAYRESLQDAVRVEIAGSAGRGGRGGFAPTHSGFAGPTGVVADISFGHP